MPAQLRYTRRPARSDFRSLARYFVASDGATLGTVEKRMATGTAPLWAAETVRGISLGSFETRADAGAALLAARLELEAGR